MLPMSPRAYLLEFHFHQMLKLKSSGVEGGGERGIGVKRYIAYRVVQAKGEKIWPLDFLYLKSGMVCQVHVLCLY